MLTGDGKLKTTEVKTQELSSFGDDTGKWPGGTTVDVSFCGVDMILGASRSGRVPSKGGSLIGIGIKVIFAGQGSMGTGCTLILPPHLGGSMWWTPPNESAGWRGDELTLYSFSATREGGGAFRTDVVLVRTAK